MKNSLKVFSSLTSLIVIMIFGGCSYSPPEPVKVVLSDKKVDYLRDVKPILDRRCVSCHSCYNSPCQAKFSSFEGVDRGGSKDKVYLATRIFAQEPSRLFIDAKNTQQWRQKKFFSLTQDLAESTEDNASLGIRSLSSIMAHMLYDKKENPELEGEYSPEHDDLVCPQTLEEVSKYLDEKEKHGMPYGFPAMEDNEYEVIMQWLAQGAAGPSKQEQKELEEPSEKVKVQINRWEAFLNKEDAKHKVTARYIYEHYFLAHINFKEDPKGFYSLVRSRTPSGEKIDVIATRRPYDNPGVQRFYYRFEKIHSTIVHKTHIVVQISDDGLERTKSLFIDTPWAQEPHEMGYEKRMSANPFVTYAQIPVAVRYQFLLDDSEYFVRTFIRGPVCKGQIALNVIHDHFWVMFQDPKYDIGVQDPQFLIEQARNLSMPIEAGSSERVYRTFSDRYRNRYTNYYRAKVNKVVRDYPQGWPIDGIWKGERASDSPALTVYRHFDSASVHKGVVGELPRTMWVIDYAQLERIYYALVAGFDIYGNVSHQTNIRRYMDFLRLEGEINFLLYMPNEVRNDIFNSWYIGDSIVDDVQNDANSLHVIRSLGNSISFRTDHPKQELIERLVDTHFLKETSITFDDVNYFRMGESAPPLPTVYKTEKDFADGLASLTVPGTGFIRHITDEGVNVAFIRIRLKNGETLVGTFVVNRWHDNVNSLFGEEDRRDSTKDTMDIVDGTIGSYPNVFFDVEEDDIPDFFDMLKNFQRNEEYYNKIDKYAISRSNKDFWKYYDWFQNRFNEDHALDAGLYDLNRYYRESWKNKNEEIIWN